MDTRFHSLGLCLCIAWGQVGKSRRLQAFDVLESLGGLSLTFRHRFSESVDKLMPATEMNLALGVLLYTSLPSHAKPNNNVISISNIACTSSQTPPGPL